MWIEAIESQSCSMPRCFEPLLDLITRPSLDRDSIRLVLYGVIESLTPLGMLWRMYEMARKVVLD